MSKQISGLPQEAVCGSAPPIAVGCSTAKVYKDGVPTGETEGVRVNIVAPGRGFAAVSVKLPESGLGLGGMTGDDISAANTAGKYVYVGFTGFSAKAYVGRDGNLGITATADRVFLADASGKPKNMTGAIPGGGNNHV
ncbi:hypothetical protein CE91St41_36850 [Oscillospiraceae bacterium]|nr:hypothetical protein CE91St40_36830 [Oscillospiraceae bacterium]BDF76796.1 hypothetical protein CE91St41_36850 [Oscillospiraceae bacterium]